MSQQEEFERECVRVAEARGWKCASGRVEVALGEGRQQGIELAFFRFDDRERVRLTSVIGSIEHIPAARLTAGLQLNARLPHGALAVRGNDLVLVETLPAAGADPAEIEAALAYLAETADHLEKTMFGPDEH